MTLPPITKKQQEILRYIYHFRFLNRVQIQTLLNHKDYRLINTWLKDLTEKEYLNRIYSTKFGENTKPAIYYIGINGIKYIKKIIDCPIEQAKKLYREKDRAEHFIASCQFIADIYLDLRNRNDDETNYKVTTSASFPNPNSPYHFLSEMSSNLVIEKETKSKEKSMKKYYLLEVLEPTLPVYSIRKRIRNYFDFYFSNSWEDNTKEEFPTVLFICPSISMLIYAKRFTKKLLSEHDDIDLKSQFAENDKIKKVGVTGDIWEEI